MTQLEQIKHEVGSKVYNSALDQLEKQKIDPTFNPIIEGHDPETGQPLKYKKNVALNLERKGKFKKNTLSFSGLGGLIGK
jgi:hypothetical protein